MQYFEQHSWSRQSLLTLSPSSLCRKWSGVCTTWGRTRTIALEPCGPSSPAFLNSGWFRLGTSSLASHRSCSQQASFSPPLVVFRRRDFPWSWHPRASLRSPWSFPPPSETFSTTCSQSPWLLRREGSSSMLANHRARLWKELWVFN